MGYGEQVGQVVFCICGPKGSLCCTILSFWGTVMLFLLGVFYYIEAAVLLEDFIESVNASSSLNYVPLEDITSYSRSDITAAYHKAAYSCFGAGGIYLLFLILSSSFLAINVWRTKVKAN